MYFAGMTITGNWKIVKAELGSKELPTTSFEHLTLVLDETSYQLIEDRVIDSGLVELVHGMSPAGMRITGVYGPNRGKTFACIYKFDGQDLILCYNLGGETFPSTFSTANQPLFYLVRYQRQ